MDLTKAFDRVRLADVVDCLRDREVPEQIVSIIKELNTDMTARIKSNNQTSRCITIKNGVRQGDSLSPMLFNTIMDKIIANLPKELGYKMGNDPILIIYYADDAFLIAESEENLQTQLLKCDQMAESLTLNLLTTTIVAPPSNASKWQMGFNSAFKGLNMVISLNKTKSLTISRNYKNVRLN